MNKIVNDITKARKGHYVHALEVNDVFELESIIDRLLNEWAEEYTQKDIIEFFNTISLYCLNDKNEDEVYNFDIEKYIKNE